MAYRYFLSFAIHDADGTVTGYANSVRALPAPIETFGQVQEVERATVAVGQPHPAVGRATLLNFQLLGQEG